MDGVLVDWNGGVARLFGIPIEAVLERFPDKQDRYERIVAHDPDFYRNLKWLPDGEILWRYLAPLSPALLTAYSKYVPRGGELKQSWADSQLGVPAERVLAYQNKWEKKQHAVNPDGSPNLLIDDEEGNVREWREAGGIAILHKSAGETIRELKELGF